MQTESALVRRSMDDSAVHPIPGSTEGRIVFWSPDGRMLGFFSEGKLRKVSIDNGSPVTLADGIAIPAAQRGTERAPFCTRRRPTGFVLGVRKRRTPVQATFPTRRPSTSRTAGRCFLPDDKHFIFLGVTNNGTVRDSTAGSTLEHWITRGETQSRRPRRMPCSSTASCVPRATAC
jgi:hypothetical protein